MHILLVIIHVTMMIASMALMISAVGLGLAGKNIAATIASIGFISTIVGFVSGGILLLGAPLSIQCAVLATYQLAATLLYHFGFAFGDAKNARLIRSQ
ncbi:MAG: hypothetical protein JWN75_151 [Candidatus Saccharibacteria bacterium]|nr:hypothetical protein [Candidatus Saccharibacteria bacterium]